MLKKSLPTFSIFFILIVSSLYLTLKVIAKEQKLAAMNQVLNEIDNSGSVNQNQSDNNASSSGYLADNRVANLKAFFRKHNSVLYDYGDLIVKTADKYGLDYRLVPAIAMQESTLCRTIPENSHNCWGWGIYGNKITRFDSYNEAIVTVSSGLKKNYVDRGLVTANQIMSVYTPSSNGSWARAVNNVIKYLE